MAPKPWNTSHHLCLLKFHSWFFLMGIVWSEVYSISKRKKIPIPKLTIYSAATIPKLFIINSHFSSEQINKDVLFTFCNTVLRKTQYYWIKQETCVGKPNRCRRDVEYKCSRALALDIKLLSTGFMKFAVRDCLSFQWQDHEYLSP